VDHYFSWTLAKECYSYLLFPQNILTEDRSQLFQEYLKWIQKEYIAPVVSTPIPFVYSQTPPPTLELPNDHSSLSFPLDFPDESIPFSLLSCLNHYLEVSPWLSSDNADSMTSMLLATGLQNSQLSESSCLWRFSLLRVALNVLRYVLSYLHRSPTSYFFFLNLNSQIRDGC
jgi:hypothetical protein